MIEISSHYIFLFSFFLCREQKLELERLKAEREEVEECSFRPTLAPPPSFSSSAGRSKSAGRSRASSADSRTRISSEFDPQKEKGDSKPVATGKIPIPVKIPVKPQLTLLQESQKAIHSHYRVDQSDDRHHSEISNRNNNNDNYSHHFAMNQYSNNHFPIEPSRGINKEAPPLLPPQQMQFVDSAMESFSSHLLRSQNRSHNQKSAIHQKINSIFTDSTYLDESESISAAYELDV